MAARAMWKGVVALGEVRVPVKLYAAISSSRVSFRLLHAADGVPVRQQMLDPISERVVEHADAQKGLELEPGRFVVLDDDDFDAIEPDASRDITPLRWVPPDALDDRWYDRAYWLGPDGDDAGYAALVEAMAAEGRVGIVRWAMRKKRYHGALRVADGHPMIVRLHPSDAVVPSDAITPPTGRAPDEREIALAEKLVEALAGDFEPGEFGGEYEAQLRALIEAKAEGRAPKAPPAKAKRASEGSLSDALEASLAAAGGG